MLEGRHADEVRDSATQGPGLTEITGTVARWLRGRADGVLTLMVRLLPASLLIQENADPDVRDRP